MSKAAKKIHFKKGADEELVSYPDHRGNLVPCHRDADGLVKPICMIQVNAKQESRLRTTEMIRRINGMDDADLAPVN